MPIQAHIRRPGGAARSACSTAGERWGRGRETGTKRDEYNTSLLLSSSEAALKQAQTAMKMLVSARRNATKSERSKGNLPLLLLSFLRSPLAKSPAAAHARQEA